MLGYVLQALREINVDKNIVVVGHQAQTVMEAFGDTCHYAQQTEQKGTGHAVAAALPALEGFSGRVLILSGDMPLITPEIVRQLLETNVAGDFDLTALTANSEAHRDFGRIIRDENGNVQRIVEAKDCTPEQYAVTEVNLGAYCAKASFLREYLPQLKPNNAQGELYLTDLVQLCASSGKRVTTLVTDNVECALGVNSRVDLAKASAAINARLLNKLMLSGVTIMDPSTTWVEPSVIVGPDSELLPGTYLIGNTVIGSGCTIGPNTKVTDSHIGNGVTVAYSVLLQGTVEDNVNIGPFAYLRPGAHICTNAKVGDFVEIKNSTIGIGSKVPHLTYVGDSQVGSKTNIGCGTITCNYDGKNKHRTVIGNGVLIGSNTSLVAPVTVGDGARTGAGSVITHDVMPNATVVGVPAKQL